MLTATKKQHAWENLKHNTGTMFGQWCSQRETDKTEVKPIQLLGQCIWGWVKFGLACPLTLGQVGTDGMAMICEPIVATSISMEKTLLAICREWAATLGNHEAMENTTTWFGKYIEWTGRKRAAMLPKDRGQITSALERNSAGSIVMGKTLDEILRASKRLIKIGCSAHTLVKREKKQAGVERSVENGQEKRRRISIADPR